MKLVAKYNVFKAISLLLTVSTPIITLFSCSELIVHRSDTAISTAGLITIVITVLLLKDKILENFKIPSPFVFSLAALVVIVCLESIIYPIKCVLTTTAIVTGIDTFTFRRIYKDAERFLPDNVGKYMKFGFIPYKTEMITGDKNEQST